MKGRMINLKPYIKRVTKKLVRTLEKELRNIGGEIESYNIDPATLHAIIHYIATCSINNMLMLEMVRYRNHFARTLTDTIECVINALQQGEIVYFDDKPIMLRTEKTPMSDGDA